MRAKVLFSSLAPNLKVNKTMAKKKNKKYVVTVREALVTNIIVSSSDKAEAAAIVQRMYDNEEIVLDYSNLIEQSVKAKLWK